MSTISASKQNKVLDKLKHCEPFLWLNPNLLSAQSALAELELRFADVIDAEERLKRFAPLLSKLFAELQTKNGEIESELIQVPNLQCHIEKTDNISIGGKLWIKADHLLPVAGSIKARGGIYEILHFAEKLAVDNKLLTESENYLKLNSATAQELFSRYQIVVGSTGNLGMSIGIMATALGFNATVHMSSDAKLWKKNVCVITTSTSLSMMPTILLQFVKRAKWRQAIPLFTL